MDERWERMTPESAKKFRQSFRDAAAIRAANAKPTALARVGHSVVLSASRCGKLVARSFAVAI